MKIGIIGLGYVGLTSAIGLTQLGHTVIGLEIDQQKLSQIKQGRMPFYEESLPELLKQVINRRFFPTANLNELIIDTEIIFICVPTPSKQDGSIDLTAIFAVAKNLAQNLDKFTKVPVIAIKSTVVPGTTAKVAQIISELSQKKNNEDFFVAMIPEFLRQGSALHDFQQPDRIVMGVTTQNNVAHQVLKAVFATVSCPKHVVDLETAEFSKYASNSFLALKITFANELANLIDKFNLAQKGRQVTNQNVINLIGLDHRINPAFMQAGVGYGGSCFPKDVKALAALGNEYNSPFHLLETTTKVNDQQPLILMDHLRSEVVDLKGKEIGILGLAFKPKTDDIREAPARTIIKELEKEQASIHAWDPLAEQIMELEFPNVCYHDRIEDLFAEVDAIVVLTAWPQIKTYFTEEHIPEHLIIIDGRNCIPNATRTIGASYIK